MRGLKSRFQRRLRLLLACLALALPCVPAMAELGLSVAVVVVGSPQGRVPGEPSGPPAKLRSPSGRSMSGRSMSGRSMSGRSMSPERVAARRVAARRVARRHLASPEPAATRWAANATLATANARWRAFHEPGFDGRQLYLDHVALLC